MDNKEKWISEVENSLNGFKRPESDSFFYTRLIAKIDAKDVNQSSYKWIGIALPISALIIINIWALNYSGKSKEEVMLKQIAIQLNLNNDNLIKY